MSDLKNTTAVVAPAAAQASPSLEASVLRFKTEVRATHRAIANSLKGGLSAVSHCAALAFQARAFGTPSKHMVFLLFGKDKLKERDGGEAKVYRAAMRLGAYWTKNGLPDEMVTANSFDAAVDGALSFLALKEVRSVEGLMSFLATGTAPKVQSVGDRVTNTVKKGVSSPDFDASNAATLGTEAVVAMGLAKSGPFVKAVNDAYAALAKAAEDAAATELAEQVGGDLQAPAFAAAG